MSLFDTLRRATPERARPIASRWITERARPISISAVVGKNSSAPRRRDDLWRAVTVRWSAGSLTFGCPWAGFYREFPAATGAALIMLLGGIYLYLNIDSMSPRYTMPAIWGLDIFLAVFCARFVRLPASKWKALTATAVAVGLVATVVANYRTQEQFIARANLLWNVVEWIERDAPEGSTIAWYGGEPASGGLDSSEGIHVQWHLDRRHRRGVHIWLRDGSGQPLATLEHPEPTTEPRLAVWGAGPAPDPLWRRRAIFVESFDLGRHRHVAQIAAIPDSVVRTTSRSPAAP